jgi:hypothetical protein
LLPQFNRGNNSRHLAVRFLPAKVFDCEEGAGERNPRDDLGQA